MLVVPAHAGHWLAQLMYVAPVLAIVGWISIRALLDRRAAKREPPGSHGPAQP
jgi:hypothetical protein